jgi:hypothetical protein
MKNLKLLGISATLVCVLAMTAFADGNDPCVPGATNSPPCAVAQEATDDALPSSEPVVESASVPVADYIYGEAVVEFVQGILSVL